MSSAVNRIAPADVRSTVEKHMLVDGFRLVVDLDQSHGSWLVDEVSGDEYLDFYTFFASSPLGFNHPRLRESAFLDRLVEANAQAIVSDLVVAEVYYALHYHYEVPKAEALATLKDLLVSGEISATGVAAAVLQTRNLASAQPGFLDRVIYRQYTRIGATLATFEKASQRLTGVEVL